LDRGVIRGVASSALVAVLFGLAACGGGQEEEAGGASTSTGSSATPSSASATEPPAPTYTPTAAPGVVDACALIPADLIAEHFGAHPQLILPDTSHLEDPRAIDCRWQGLDMQGDAQITGRPDQYMSRDAFEDDYAELEGSVPVEASDWGWMFANRSAGTFAVSFVKGDLGLSFAVTVDNSEHDEEDLRAFVDELMQSLAAAPA
jgi:hypothetical protein